MLGGSHQRTPKQALTINISMVLNIQDSRKVKKQKRNVSGSSSQMLSFAGIQGGKHYWSPLNRCMCSSYKSYHIRDVRLYGHNLKGDSYWQRSNWLPCNEEWRPEELVTTLVMQCKRDQGWGIWWGKTHLDLKTSFVLRPLKQVELYVQAVICALLHYSWRPRLQCRTSWCCQLKCSPNSPALLAGHHGRHAGLCSGCWLPVNLALCPKPHDSPLLKLQTWHISGWFIQFCERKWPMRCIILLPLHWASKLWIQLSL